MESVKDRFVRLMLEGLSGDVALALALAETIEVLRAAKRSEAAMERIESELGFRDLGEARELHYIVNENIYALIVEGAKRLRDIPSASCIQSHLPRGRKATEDDLRRAWDLCCNQS